MPRLTPETIIALCAGAGIARRDIARELAPVLGYAPRTIRAWLRRPGFVLTSARNRRALLAFLVERHQSEQAEQEIMERLLRRVAS